MKKKWSLLLVFALLIGICFSVPVSANEDNGEVAGEIKETTTESESTTDIETGTDTTETTETYVFELNEDKTGYILVGINDTNAGFEVPAYYNGLPVVEIDTTAFRSFGSGSIVIPETIHRMTGDGFYMKYLERIVSIDNLYAWCNIDFESIYSNPLYTEEISSLGNKQSTLSIGGSVKRNLIIPDGIEKIKDYAFVSCGNIGSLILPKSVTEIGSQAFFDCENLRHVYYYGSEDELTINETAFSNIENIKFHFNMDSHNISYDYDKFEAMGCKEPTCTENGKVFAQCSCGYTWFETVDQLYHNFENEHCTRCDISVWQYTVDDSQGTLTITGYLDNGGTVLVLPPEIDGNTVAGIRTFYMSSKLASEIETVVIPDTVKSITGPFNFVGFNGLKRLVIPESVTEIADDMMKFGRDLDVIIYGVSGSKAEEYALSQGMEFVDMSTIYSIDTEKTEVTDGMLIVDEIEETEIDSLLKPAEDYTVSVVPTQYNIYSTGTKVQIKDKDGVVLKEHTLVVKGDLNGDGVCDALDCMLVELARTKSTNLAKSAFLAGNLTDDSEITIDDFNVVVNKAIN